MTDSHSPVKTHIALTVDPIAGIEPAPSVVKGSAASRSVDLPVDEEEDYTIKCICGFQDDDGNTVFCELCETWQHIQCYYFRDNEPLPDVSEVEHKCADCDPKRQLNAQAASERQSKRRNEHDPRKVKKTTTKSQKRKIKVSEPQNAFTNGCLHERNDSHDRTTTALRDSLPPAKRPKTTHRTSNSINTPLILSNSSLSANKPSSLSARNPRGSAEYLDQPPADEYVSQLYSATFLDLYNDDPGDAPMQANLFNDITITRSLSSWSHDVESLREATNGLSPQDVFHRCDQPLDSMTLPRLHKEQKEDSTVVVAGRHPQWRFLTIDSLTPKDSIVGELRGKIGHMHDYVGDIANRWNYLRHPVPFVFFHPKLPIYVDTRREGSTCRYLRRSCCPNLSMKTILENGSDYHFCFVAKHDLEAGTELTIGWVPDEHMRKFFSRNDEMRQEVTADAEEDYVSDWVGKVLADFGGCACESPSQCSFARFDRRNGRTKSHGSKLLSNGKISKGRNGYTNRPSPPRTGFANKGRADNEALRSMDDEVDDNRSNSGSLRSKPRSRDMTPSRRNPGDSGSAPGVPLSDREKRKIAAVEKNFEQLEQGGQQPAQKKKKRNSGGPSLSTSAATGSKHAGHSITSFSQPNTPSLLSGPNHINPSAVRRRSASPVTDSGQNSGEPHTLSSAPAKKFPPPISSAVHKVYVDCAVQTDPTEVPYWDDLDSPPKRIKKPYISLTKRLLLRCQRDRRRLEAHQGNGLNIPNETQNIPQEPCSSGVVQHATHSPPNVDAKSTPDDSNVNPESTLAISPKHSSFNVPLEKPRPPGQAPLGSDPTAHKAPVQIPPLPSPPQENQIPSPPLPSNGTYSADLLQQSPLPKQESDELTTKFVEPAIPSFIATPSPVVQVPKINHNSLPANATHIANIAQPSPVRKKLSVAEYIKLVNTNKTESLSASDSQTINSPVLQLNTPKTASKPDVQAPRAALTTTGASQGTNRVDDDPLNTGKDPKL